MHGLISLTPIGVVRSPFLERVDAPRQPEAALGVRARIELVPSAEIEHALCDLEGWEYIWVIFVFHKNEGWRPKVLPPRSDGKRRGVFATRAPYRPNPIGLSVVKLERVEGCVVHIQNVDILDGSPVLDIKPYVPYADAYPGARTGWLDSDEPEGEVRARGAAKPKDPRDEYDVTWSAEAEAHLAFLREHGVDVRPALAVSLALGPQPHPYRRIKKVGSLFRIGVKDWRAYFEVTGRTIAVSRLETGYPKKELDSNRAPELDVHRAFVARFPGSRKVTP